MNTISRSTTLLHWFFSGISWLAAIGLLLSVNQHSFASDINLVKLGNFESFSSPWGTGQYSKNGLWWNSKNANTRATSVTGIRTPFSRISSALRIENHSAAGPHIYGNTSQRIAAKSGTNYRVSFWAKTKNLKSNGGISIAYDSSWRVRPISLPAGTKGWTYYAGTFNTGRANYIDLRIISQDIGTVWITALQIHEVKKGIAHIQYSHPVNQATVHAFVFDPSQFVIYKSSPRSAAKSYTDVSSRIGADVLVNGTFIGGLPSQAFGDFRLNGVYNGYAGAATQGPKNLIEMLNNRYHFYVTKNSAGKYGAGISGGRVSSSARSGKKWAIGGLGALLKNGAVVPFERSGSRHLYKNINGRAAIARSAIGVTRDNKIILLTVGKGANRRLGVSIANLGKEMLWLGAKDAASLDGGSASLAYYKYVTPSLVAAPVNGYLVNKSFVGAQPRP
ncbi:MAG: phosphodiester glycosidase family protein [Methylococcales bacterium]|jgi:hypothetical protein|nr:phosphodiester glycosidase family protein [Methylococcales bacterium]MBT7444701.1 phosphodiester glycosidase family protein [Methylococcales bacterium]